MDFITALQRMEEWYICFFTFVLANDTNINQYFRSEHAVNGIAILLPMTERSKIAEDAHDSEVYEDISLYKLIILIFNSCEYSDSLRS
jgi:hypothetical protein